MQVKLCRTFTAQVKKTTLMRQRMVKAEYSGSDVQQHKRMSLEEPRKTLSPLIYKFSTAASY